jgi:hypothetical protein
MSVKIILHDDGKMEIDVDLPDGPECDETDAALRTALACIGLVDESIFEAGEKTAIPEAQKKRVKG